MKNVKLLLIIIMAVMLESCYPYRIQIYTHPGYSIYTPMYKKRRLSMWRQHYGSFNSEEDARRQIEQWKQDKNEYRKSRVPRIIRIR